MITLNDAWLATLHKIQTTGTQVSPRGKNTLEVLDNQVRFSMRCPVLTLKDRKLGYKFMCAEAAWMLSGDNRVVTISPYSKAIANFSDDGIFFGGAYGPKIIDQLTYIIDSLHADNYTRQAVINIWRERPRSSADTPCTLSLQWMLRENKLHCFVRMRSSDIFLGLAYDGFNFSMLSGIVLQLLRLRNLEYNFELGDLFLSAASQHLYISDLEKIQNISATTVCKTPIFEPQNFIPYSTLIQYLWNFANATKPITSGFLRELSEHVHSASDS